MLIFPFLLTYEILGLFVNHKLPFEIRNGADVLLRQAFLYFDEFGKIILFMSLILFLVVFFLKGKKIVQDDNFKTLFLLMMIFEGLLYGNILYFIFNQVPNLLIVGKQGIGTIEKLYLSIGAGIFEELIFRLILIGIISFSLIKILKIKLSNIFIPILIISSIIFSGFHYIGYFSDVFQWTSFLLRFSAGCYLGFLYLQRGFGICVVTHIIYDFLVIKGTQ